MQSETFNAIVLGLVQGLTEFLPISSDGHVALISQLIDFPVSLQEITWLHAGTLAATVTLFRHDIADLLKYLSTMVHDFPVERHTDKGRLVVAILYSTLVTAAIGFSLRHVAEAANAFPWLIGIFLAISGLAVGITKMQRERFDGISVQQALLIGCAQGLAVMPGLSRSGLTIGLAMALGMSGAQAFRYSFLISVPAVFGALLLENPWAGPGLELGFAQWLGVVTAFVSGIGALWLVRRLIVMHKFWVFALYLIPVGIAVAWWTFPGS